MLHDGTQGGAVLMNGPLLAGGPFDAATTQESAMIQLGQFLVPISGPMGARLEAADVKPAFPMKVEKVRPSAI